MNLLDRAIAYTSPERAVKREAARLQHKALAGVGTSPAVQSSSATQTQRSETRWRGASRMLRSLASWIPKLGSARTDLPDRERTTLIARSYDAYRNHLIARAAITRNKTNVVGTGLIMHPAVDGETLGLTEDETEALNDTISRQFATWADNPIEVDCEATLDLYGLQSLALVSALLAGDCFALTPHIETPLWGLKVQMVDGARVSNPQQQPNTRNMIDGVQLDDLGKPIWYHVRSRHPADPLAGASMDRWDPVPVIGENTGRRRAMHVWNEKDRIGQVRGAPYLAPIIEPLQTIEQYSRAELVAAVVSAMLTVFIEKDSQQFDEDGEPIKAFAGEETKSGDDAPTLELGNGAVVDLAPGEKAKDVNPARPNSNYDKFFLSIARQIGAALEIPLDELMLKYESSYSAARAAMLQAWRFYTTRRWSLVQQFCQPLYQLWFDEAVARGRLEVSGYSDPVRRAAYTSAIWVGPARGAMDEDKEAKAAAKRIEIGVSNETIETAAMTGEDWRIVHATRQRELKTRSEGFPEPQREAARTGPELPEPAPQEDEETV